MAEPNAGLERPGESAPPVSLTWQHRSSMWASGRYEMRTSVELGRWSPICIMTALMDATTFSCDSMTPLGLPVVPDV